MSKENTYSCVNCGSRFTDKGVHYICKTCALENKEGQALKGVLKVVYPYAEIKQKLALDSDYLKKSDYLDLLPIESLASMPPLLVGKTPLYTFEQHSVGKSSFSMHLKVESLLIIPLL